jgi:tetratricopeptide (TPR) repeat protein
VERLTHYEAVRLFVERAQAVKADFSVTNDNAPAVAEICYRLDGLPLAIELAAARIKVLSPQKILGRLGNRLKLLTGGARDLPERQRTLRSAIEWSYGLLEEREKVLFGRLSVFAGGRTLEAIEAICDAKGDLPVDVLDGLSSLVDESLLKQEEGVGGESSFYMLETIREYAREKLEESGEAEELRWLHAQYFLALAEEAKPRINEAERDLWRSRLETEHGNLRAALRWAMDTEDSSTALRLADAIFWFWFHRGYWKEGRGWLEEALGLPGASMPTAERAEALAGVGILAWLQGDHDVARSRLEESVALCRNLQYRSGLVQPLQFLSMEMLGRGDTMAARSMAEESVEIARAGDSGFDLAIVLANLGLAAHTQNDYAVARSVLRECIEICREIGDNWLLSLPYRHLGYMELREGNYEQATALFKEGLSTLRDVKEKWFVARAVESLAISSAMQGDYARAGRLFGAGETLREAVGASVQAFYRPDYDRGIVAAREGTDKAAWEDARAQGRAMTLDEAVSYALEEEADG